MPPIFPSFNRVVQKNDPILDRLEEMQKEFKSEFDEVRKDISKLDRRMQDLEHKTRNIALPLNNEYMPAQPITGHLDGDFVKRKEDEVELGLFY